MTPKKRSTQHRRKFQHRGHAADTSYVAAEPAEATQVQPGTRDKIELMAERMARGEELFHAADRNCIKGEDE